MTAPPNRVLKSEATGPGANASSVGCRFGAIIPALLVSLLKRLHDSAVETRHIHDSVIGTDIALNQPMRDFLCVLDGHRGDFPLASPAMAGSE